jgi:hypothetical protein
MNETTEQTTATDQPAPASADGQTANAPAENESEELTLWQMLGSVMAAAFGVQSKKNRERDFTKGKPIHFIILGIGFTVAFVLIMSLIVRLILSNVT